MRNNAVVANLCMHCIKSIIEEDAYFLSVLAVYPSSLKDHKPGEQSSIQKVACLIHNKQLC